MASLGPPDCMVLCSIEGYNEFPKKFGNAVLHKLHELGIAHALLAIEGPYLKIGFVNGPLALAALSMDGAEISADNEVKQLSVQLRSPDWEDDWTLRIAPSFKREPSCINLNNIDGLSIVNLNIEDDEEDTVSLVSARSYSDFNSSREPKSMFIFMKFKLKHFILVEEQILVQTAAPTLAAPRLPPPPRPPTIPPPVRNGHDNQIPVIPPRPSPENWPPKFT